MHDYFYDLGIKNLVQVLEIDPPPHSNIFVIRNYHALLVQMNFSMEDCYYV